MPNENDMPNEKDMLIEAYRIQVERWNKRRDIEWRLTLTLWSTILITTFALAGKIQYHFGLIGIIIYMVLFGIYCFWICNLWRRNACDKDWMYNYQKKINEKLSHLTNSNDVQINHSVVEKRRLEGLECSFTVAFYICYIGL